MTEIRTAIPDKIDKYLDALVRTGPFTSKAELVRAALLSFVSQAGPITQDFDKENMMAPDGRIYQLEYARESGLRGAPGVGLVYEGGVLLAAAVPPPSPLAKEGGKVHRLQDRLAVLGSGLVADLRMVVRHLELAKVESTDQAVDVAVEFFWQHTVDRGKRPLGAALLLASTLDGDPRLVYVDPSGATVEYDAVAIGMDEETRMKLLEERYRLGPADEAEALALEALGRPDHYVAVRVAA